MKSNEIEPCKIIVSAILVGEKNRIRNMHIKLSKISRKQVIEICQKVKNSNSPDSKWRDVADNTINNVRQHGGLTPKQTNWICKQAKYHQLDLPEELRDFETSSHSKSNGLTQTESDFLFGLLGHVKNLEDLITRHIQKLRRSS
jgi:hypothetical protein